MGYIGVASQMFGGKDTLADYLQIRLNERRADSQPLWERSAFAKAVKDIFCSTFGKDMDYVEQWKPHADPPLDLDMSVRKSLQFIGDGFRTIKGSIWIDLMFRDKKGYKIISDVRYINELKAVKEHGGFNILIVRPDKLNNDSNGSEAQMRPLLEYALDLRDSECLGTCLPPAGMELIDLVVYNDGTIAELYQHADDVVVPAIEKFFKEKK